MNHTRLICIARCKNEIKIIDKWIHSLPFVDLFSIVDNGSTDGTFEYLLNNPKVKLQKSQGFHEGRDFDLALTEARKYNPQWLLKLDCDEFFEKKAQNNFYKLLNQNKFHAVAFRMYNFDYRLKPNEYLDLQQIKHQSPPIKLVKNSVKIKIAYKKIHVGSFLNYKRPALSNFRIKHFSTPNYNKAKQKYENYNSIKEPGDERTYSDLINTSTEYINKLPKKEFPSYEIDFIKNTKKYGLPRIEINIKKINIKRSVLNKAFIKRKIKSILF